MQMPLDFPSHPFSVLGPHPRYYIALTFMSPKPSLGCDDFSDSVLMTLRTHLLVLRSTGQVFCRLFLNMYLSDAFIMIRLRFYVFVRKTILEE